MEPKNIILFVVIIVLLIIVIGYIAKDVNTLTGLTEATTMQKIEATDLDTNNSNSSNFTYSIWFYIDDWNYNYGKPKVIFGRMTTGKDDIPESGSKFIVHSCAVANIPIQKWVNLFISVYGRTLDIYIDGKLVRTCVLPGVASIDPNAPVYITPYGGFSGWTSNFQYWSDASDPQKAWNIYKKGYGSSMLGGLFGKYTIKVSLMEGDVESSSYTI